MERYGSWAPTGLDHEGAFLRDRQEWFVVPVGMSTPRCRHVACTGRTATGARVVAPVESQRCAAAVLYGDERCNLTRDDRRNFCTHHDGGVCAGDVKTREKL